MCCEAAECRFKLQTAREYLPRRRVNFMLIAAITNSADVRLVALAVVGAGAGVYWFYKGFRLLQRKRLILDTPASKIRSAAMGLVELSGLAVGPYVVTSPMKQAGCYYYRSIAWELKQRGKSSEWVKVAEESLHVPFYLDDNTAKILVDPRGADMDLHCDLQEKYNAPFSFGSSMPGSVADFLMRHGVNPDKQIKVEEYCIKPKNFLFVLGTLSQNPGLDASIMPAWAKHPAQLVPAANQAATEAPAPEVIRLSQPQPEVPVAEMTQQQKVAAALMKAGISNPAAWNAAGVGVQMAVVKPFPKPQVAEIQAVTAAAVTAEEEPATASGNFDLHPPVVLMKGMNEPAFFVSWRSQRDVIKSLGWKSSLMIWGGPILTLACVAFLLANFGWL